MNDKFSILVVDDNQNMAEALSDILVHIGHKIMIALSGKEAVEKIKNGSFNLLITDIRMDQMNGVELCRAIKQIQHDIPVIMMTAYANDELVKEGLNAGAIDVLPKPLDIDNLLRHISTLSMKEN